MTRNQKSTLYRQALVVGVITATVHCAFAQVPDAQDTANSPGNQTGLAKDAAQVAAGSVDEVQKLLSADSLVTLRSTTNGSYTAQLLINRKAGVYYAALSQQGALWRVVTAQDEAFARSAYGVFVKETGQLSTAEVRKARLEMQQSQLEQRLAQERERQRSLQADFEVAREQQALSDVHQQQAIAQSTELLAQRDAKQVELHQAQTEVDRLRRQVNAELPTTQAKDRHASARKNPYRH